MRLRLREEALGDLDSIYAWYIERNPAVARTIIARVRERLDHLETFPEIGEQAAGRRERILLITGTPLVAVYRLDADLDLIDVLSVVDGRRHPRERFRP